MEWARKYLKMDSRFFFTDEIRTTPGGPNGWANGWAYFVDECHNRLRRQQQGGGVVIWAGIIRDRLVGPIRVPEGVKVKSIAYCNLLKESLVTWLDYIPLSLLRDNALPKPSILYLKS